jgi:DNA-binding NarL/FixJ family response regulator
MRPNDRIRVLIAHDDPLISAGLVATIGSMPDFETIVSPLHDTAPDAVIADYATAIRLTAAAGPLGRRVIVLTHSDSEANICYALEHGARGYLLMGCSLQDLCDGLRSVSMGGIALGPVVATRMAERMRQQALTDRQAEILRCLMLGLSNKAIASKLALAVGTIKSHVKSILGKLEASSRTEAVSIAQRRGILRDQDETPMYTSRLRARRKRTVLESAQTQGGNMVGGTARHGHEVPSLSKGNRVSHTGFV